MQQLGGLQMKLLENAKACLSSRGAIWYMTCSILSEENEQFVQQACERLNLVAGAKKEILPNEAGWDGGFACVLHKRAS